LIVGLDAVVYKKLQSFPSKIQHLLQLVDSATGEMDFVDGTPDDLRTGVSLIAADEPIGNIANVHWLTREIQQRSRCGCNVLVSSVLYSGSHCGDVLTVAQTASLERELDGIDTAGEQTGNLVEFIASMRRLTAASREQGNPIVFV